MEYLNQGKQPVFRATLETALRQLGLAVGDKLIAHVSLKSMGYVIGGVQTVAQAIQCVLTEQGTLIVPTQTAELSHPATWQYPPAPPEWIEAIAEAIPSYQPDSSPVSDALGKFCAYMCFAPNTYRSKHPIASFSVWGHQAEAVAAQHELDLPFGSHSPLGWLVANQGKILQIGTDFETNTAIHYAESLLYPVDQTERAKVNNEWVTFKLVEHDRFDDYLELQAAFLRDCPQAYRETVFHGATLRVIELVPFIHYVSDYYRKKLDDINNQ